MRAVALSLVFRGGAFHFFGFLAAFAARSLFWFLFFGFSILVINSYLFKKKIVSDEPYHNVGGALWFIQMWFFAYFPKLSDKKPTSYTTLGLHVSHSLRTMPFDDLMSFFL